MNYWASGMSVVTGLQQQKISMSWIENADVDYMYEWQGEFQWTYVSTYLLISSQIIITCWSQQISWANGRKWPVTFFLSISRVPAHPGGSKSRGCRLKTPAECLCYISSTLRRYTAPPPTGLAANASATADSQVYHYTAEWSNKQPENSHFLSQNDTGRLFSSLVCEL